MLRASMVSFALTLVAMALYVIVTVILIARKSATIGIFVIVNYTVLSPFFWLAAVAVFFIAYRHFLRSIPHG